MKSLNSSLCGYGSENGAMGDILQIWQCRYRQFIFAAPPKAFTTLYHVDDTRDLLACIVTLRTFA